MKAVFFLDRSWIKKTQCAIGLMISIVGLQAASAQASDSHCSSIDGEQCQAIYRFACNLSKDEAKEGNPRMSFEFNRTKRELLIVAETDHSCFVGVLGPEELRHNETLRIDPSDYSRRISGYGKNSGCKKGDIARALKKVGEFQAKTENITYSGPITADKWSVSQLSTISFVAVWNHETEFDHCVRPETPRNPLSPIFE